MRQIAGLTSPYGFITFPPYDGKDAFCEIDRFLSSSQYKEEHNEQSLRESPSHPRNIHILWHDFPLSLSLSLFEHEGAGSPLVAGFAVRER